MVEFEAQYRLAELMTGIDMLCVPTIPRFVSLAEIAADPNGPNSLLGTYSKVVNLLDMSGIAVPCGLRADGRPASVTLLGWAADGLLAAAVMQLEDTPTGATGWARPPAQPPSGDAGPEELAIFVCGAHMSGMALNGELASLGARFLRSCRTAPSCKLYALAGGPPQRPGLSCQAQGDRAIAGELRALPLPAVGRFLAGITAPTGLGTAALQEGSEEVGFICEPIGVESSTDVSGHGGWRGLLDQLAAPRRMTVSAASK
ncbi:MAG: allophanate hydrolase-related protein [Salipiger thiooxidans]|uniref:allophanate hydrolase-related protein n=1 Tax=Salipiger thiooxidans TaxID=282683 RepID=UPI001CFA9DB5|nr:hypothetical protein [Salipiger thiooxidans]